MIKRGLGKGLNSLIEETAGVVSTQDALHQVLELDMTYIDPNTKQPRKRFDSDKISDLADSIAQHGVVQPIIVKPVGNRYIIVAGERRFRAARKAGLSSIPAIIKDVSGQDLLEIALIENIQREDLNPIEEAEAISSLVQDYHLTQEAVAHRLGRSRPTVANTLRLLTLPEPIREMLTDGRITAGHARPLIPLPSADLQLSLAQLIATKNLSVREAELLAQKALHPKSPKEKQVKRSLELEAFESFLREALSTKVAIMGSPQKGKIQIHYYSAEALDRMYELLSKINQT